MEKENKILKNILKRKIKMTTAVLVAFLISGSLSFASVAASALEPEEAARENVPPGSIPENPPEPNDPGLYDPNGTDVYVGKEDNISIWSNTIKVTNGRNRIPISDGTNISNNKDLNKYVKGNSGTYYKDPDGAEAAGTLGAPDQDIRLEINEKSITLNHISDELKNYIDNRSAAGGAGGGGTAAPTNITSTTLNVTDAADGSGKNIELKNDTVDTAHLKDNAVTTEKINNGAVTTNKLGDNSVTTEKIVNGNVTTEKLADGAITADKLANNAVTENKIANNAVTENKIADNAVTENKINNGAVSKDKLSEPLKTEIDGKANKTEVYTKIDEVSITKDADGNGTVDVKGKDGKSGVSLNGKDGSIGINGKDGSSVSMTTEKGPKGIDKENEKPRMTYEFTNEKKNPDGTPVIDPATNKPVTETVKETLATMNDGLYFAGDNNTTTISKKLNEKLEIVGGADRDKLTKNNIGVNANAEGKLEVQLSKELKGMRSAEFTDPNTGNIVKITGEGTTITNPKTGDTVIMNQGGITISKTDKDGKPNNVSLSREGLSNGGNKITNVAAGDISEGSTDVVNGRQLHQVQAQVDQNAQNIQNVNQKVDRLGERVNKGLAGAAAMSGIEFMEIGINQATVAAAVGGYRGTHAVAVGVQAAPTENTRVNAKMSLTPGSRTEVMYSVGAAYRFNLK